MALEDLGYRDMVPHLRDTADDSDRIKSNNGLHILLDHTGFPIRPVYHEATDKILTVGSRVGSNDSPIGSVGQFVGIDPDLFAGTSLNENGAFPTASRMIFHTGQVNDSNNQRLFLVQDMFDTRNFQEMDPATGALINSDIFSSLFTYTQHATISSINPGGWDNAPGAPTTAIGGWLFFDGMVDGGFDNVPGGAGAYPDGLALLKCEIATVSVAQDANDAFIWIDLATGDCVGNMTIPGDAGGAGIFHEPSINGDSFEWGWSVCFVRDDDSTFAKPKGELRIFSEILTSSPVATFYTRRVDFNPYGVTSGILRTHGRIQETSNLTFNYAPLDTGWPSPNPPNPWFMYRPLTNRIFTMQGLIATSTSAPLVQEAMLREFGTGVAVEEVSRPAALSPVRTADTITFESVAFGSIGERVAGASATWVLKRASSRDEVLTVTGGIGTTSTVDNPGIDANAAGDPEGTLVVRSITAGVPTILVEGGGNDYTAVLATGVITWVTDQQGPDSVECDYDHTGTVVDDGATAGTLLSSSAESDEDGKIRTRVNYPDDSDLVGFLDVLDVEVTT